MNIIHRVLAVVYPLNLEASSLQELCSQTRKKVVTGVAKHFYSLLGCQAKHFQNKVCFGCKFMVKTPKIYIYN